MIRVLIGAWALLLGMLLLQVGNGMQSTILGIRGQMEGFSTFHMSLVMAGYFAGFLFGSRMAPELIRRVGHVRVFAALASLISAVMILYPVMTDPVSWGLGRVVIGFCFSGVYVTAESWLNNTADNNSRGKALSLYMIMQMGGMVIAQGLVPIADPGGFVLFIIPSVLVSLSFAPILLSISPTPAFDTTKPLTLRQLLAASPLGCIGMFMLGGLCSSQIGMGPVFGAEAGLSVGQISMFISGFYIGALLLQYPIGWMSDRMDRRVLICVVAAICGAGAVLGLTVVLGLDLNSNFAILVVATVVIGGTSNPLYSLLIAYTNDFLDQDDMAAAAGGLIFIYGLGAVGGPVIAGWIMEFVGPQGFFLQIGIIAFALAGYAIYRMSRRPRSGDYETQSYTTISPSASPAAVGFAQEYDIEVAQDEAQS